MTSFSTQRLATDHASTTASLAIKAQLERWGLKEEENSALWKQLYQTSHMVVDMGITCQYLDDLKAPDSTKFMTPEFIQSMNSIRRTLQQKPEYFYETMDAAFAAKLPPGETTQSCEKLIVQYLSHIGAQAALSVLHKPSQVERTL